MADIEPIRFTAEIIRIQTMASGAIRYVIETSESDIDVMLSMAECRLRGALLEVAALPREFTIKDDDRKLHF